ncbi:DUF2797 domain-containing protein [Streptomyces sp. NPDC006879]|uniref:DUF2797 domain-containing protein n=1 Tax=Streptomyces sp. NPDC006879 TaxID=3364767 RepID=UPI0036C230EA
MWRCTGLRWSTGGARLGWFSEEVGERWSSLRYGQELGFAARGDRRCLGVRRAGRRTPCPRAELVEPRSGNAQCPECNRLDRSFSVAADTRLDDPRPYRVYLAWFGPGVVKVGITAEERGVARLLEQGAVAFTWLGRGPLMAARRTEEVVRAALSVPDRISYARKRALRGSLPPLAERAAEVARLYRSARELGSWPESLEPLPCEVLDQSVVFGLRRVPRPARVVTHLLPGTVVVGSLAAAAGPDLHLADGLVVDVRLLAGWVLVAAGAGEPGGAVPVKGIEQSQGRQGGLF